MAAPTTRLVIIKRFKYRNVNEDWGNSYILSGSTPADATAWRALFDALVLEEKKLYTSVCTVVKGYGYSSVADGAPAVWSVDMTVSPNTPVAGVFNATGSQGTTGDTASWVRWGLDRFNSKGKRVYLRKYFHDVYVTGGAQADQLSAAYLAALTAFGGKMRDGTFTGSRVVTDKLGTAVVGAGVSPYATTRTLKRRGKRPGS